MSPTDSKNIQAFDPTNAVLIKSNLIWEFSPSSIKARELGFIPSKAAYRLSRQGAGRISQFSLQDVSLTGANVDCCELPAGLNCHNLLPSKSSIILQYLDSASRQPIVPIGELIA